MIDLSVVVLILAFIIVFLVWRLKKLHTRLQEAAFGKRSLSVRYGKMSEQFFPFLKNYPYQSEKFRFLGSPIDGVQFEKDKIVFVEFKSGDSKLSARQREIKKLVENKKVEFEEHVIR